MSDFTQDEINDAKRALITHARNHKKVGGTSFIQRSLQLGFNRSSRLMELLEKENFISAPDMYGKRMLILDNTRPASEGER